MGGRGDQLRRTRGHQLRGWRHDRRLRRWRAGHGQSGAGLGRAPGRGRCAACLRAPPGGRRRRRGRRARRRRQPPFLATCKRRPGIRRPAPQVPRRHTVHRGRGSAARRDLPGRRRCLVAAGSRLHTRSRRGPGQPADPAVPCRGTTRAERLGWSGAFRAGGRPRAAERGVSRGLPAHADRGDAAARHRRRSRAAHTCTPAGRRRARLSRRGGQRCHPAAHAGGVTPRRDGRAVGAGRDARAAPETDRGRGAGSRRGGRVRRAAPGPRTALAHQCHRSGTGASYRRDVAQSAGPGVHSRRDDRVGPGVRHRSRVADARREAARLSRAPRRRAVPRGRPPAPGDGRRPDCVRRRGPRLGRTPDPVAVAASIDRPWARIGRRGHGAHIPAVAALRYARRGPRVLRARGRSGRTASRRDLRGAVSTCRRERAPRASAPRSSSKARRRTRRRRTSGPTGTSRPRGTSRRWASPS